MTGSMVALICCKVTVSRSAGACPRIGEVVTPGVYFYLSFSLLDVLYHLHIASFVAKTSLMTHKTCFREF